MKKTVLLIAVCFVLCFCFSQVLAEDGVEYEFAFAVHSISDNQYIRHVGPDATNDVLGNDEYYAIYITIHNNSDQQISFSEAEMVIDDDKYVISETTIDDHAALSWYLGYDVYNSLSDGLHTFIFRVDDKQVLKKEFEMPKKFAMSEDKVLTQAVVKGGIGIFRISDESYLRAGNETGSLGNDEYMSFMIEVTNTGSEDVLLADSFFRIDESEDWIWENLVVKPGETKRCHLYYASMEKLTEGYHHVEFYLNKQLLYSENLKLGNVESSTWDCPECGRTGNSHNFCENCGHPAPWKEDNKEFQQVTDADKKSKINLPYGLHAGMTVEEADQCMQAAGFKPFTTANDGDTVYYESSNVLGFKTYSTLMSVFSDGVTHVIHFFLEENTDSADNPSAEYLKMQSMLNNEYGAVSYSVDGGSDGWVNGSYEMHFGYLISNDALYYVLAYWYLPDNITYPGF